MKFKRNKDYNFIFHSKPFKVGNDYFRWYYKNMYGFSNKNKSTCVYTGNKCNFNLTLQYKTTVQGEITWLEYESFEPCITKRQMMDLINNYKFNN